MIIVELLRARGGLRRQEAELKFDNTVAHREVVKSKGSCRVVLK